MLDEAMIIDAENRYRDLSTQLINRKKPKEINEQLAQLRSEINIKTNTPNPIDGTIVKSDRDKLKSLLRNLPQRS